ncbi:unnamed protein product [Symbiodinium sp. CCMP2592]|nr:unnamed protein product [Symbiodinium sp. CCMP2592]
MDALSWRLDRLETRVRLLWENVDDLRSALGLLVPTITGDPQVAAQALSDALPARLARAEQALQSVSLYDHGQSLAAGWNASPAVFSCTSAGSEPGSGSIVATEVPPRAFGFGAPAPSLAPRFRPPSPVDVSVVSKGGFAPLRSARVLPNMKDFPPAPAHPYKPAAPGTLLSAWQNAKNEQLKVWLALASTAAAASEMVSELLQSPNSSVLLVRLVQGNAPSTLTNYFGRWKHWVEFCQVQSADEWAPKVAFLCDFLITHCKGLLGSAIAWLKAFRFVTTRLEVQSFKLALQSEAVRAFGKSVNVVQRRETAPFPLSFVIWLERQVLDAAQFAAHRIRCGFLLVCVFASLRWSDAPWSPPSFLHLDRQALLGCATRTKTTSRSMPWGAWAPGFLARPQTAPGWGQVWLCMVQEAVTRTSAARPGFQPDFLVADLGPDDRAPVFLAPLSRAAGVVLIRRLLAMCYESYPADQRPDLSLLACIVPKSRPLALQSSIVQAVANGFRPLRPALRGGAPPLPDITVAVPALEPAASDSRAPPVVPRLHDREPLVLDQDSSSDSEDDAPAAPEVESTSAAPAAAWELVSSGDAAPSPQDLGEPEEFEFLFNPMTSIVHLAKPCRADHPACQFRPAPDAVGDAPLRPGCSIRGNLAIGALVRTSVIPKGARLCLKHGCGKDPALASLLDS